MTFNSKKIKKVIGKIQNLSWNEELLNKFVFFNSIKVKRVGNFQGF